MGIKKFITTVTESLGLDVSETTKKKKALKILIKKLGAKKRELKKSLKITVSKKERKELEEEYKIVSIQLKKGVKILQKLKLEK